jgi:hypothetical protein
VACFQIELGRHMSHPADEPTTQVGRCGPMVVKETANVELSVDEIRTLIGSLTYSKRAVSDAQSTASEVRRQNLERIESVLVKLRACGAA